METVILWLIIGAAAALGLRALYRSLTGKGQGCACSGPCPGRGAACPPDGDGGQDNDFPHQQQPPRSAGDHDE
ncbi:MAG: hypothetical protein OEV91_01045 [Desulfobulbaceae bacterium]|nr:hypothetical protein [Desulfobulbaceae bacterium]